MSKNKQKIQRLTLAAFFVAIEVVMAYTPIGYIPVGALSITTMHLPVILAGVLCGPAFGAGMGFVFGLTSFLRATFSPTITSFVFSPFITVGGISGNFWSLVICFVPRILLGFLSGVIFRALYKHMHNKALAAGITAAVNTVLHTAGVLGGIYVFFAPEYASALGTSLNGVIALLMATVTSNMLLETALAAVVVPLLYKALAPAAERMGMSSTASIRTAKA
jgi:uncharacterized membrane protein